MEMIIVIIWI